MKKRMISIVLALALLVQLLPTYVFATDSPEDLVIEAPPVWSELEPVWDDPAAFEPELTEPEASAASAETEPAEMELDPPSGQLVLGELPEQRGESEKHFRMDDGSFIAVDYGVPVHYSTDGGESWEDIDNTLLLQGGAGPNRAQAMGGEQAAVYTAENGDSVHSFAQNLRSGFLFSAADGAYGLSVSLSEPNTEGLSLEPAGSASETAAQSEPPEAQDQGPELPAAPSSFNRSAEAEISYPDREEASPLPAAKPEPGTANAAGVQSAGALLEEPDPAKAAEADQADGDTAEADPAEALPSLSEQITPPKLRTELLYRDVYENVDLRYELYSRSVKETILVKAPLDSYGFPFYLDLCDLRPEENEDGSIALRDADGKEIYLIPAPYMFDADGTESDAVSYTLKEAESGSWTLTITADAEWINDETRVFPVAIDPTFYFAGNSSNAQIYSGYINDNSPNTHPADSSYYIRCGSYQNSGATAGHSIGLIYVNKLPSIPENCVVTTSMLKLFQTNYSNGNTGYFNYPRLYASQIIDPSFNSNSVATFINSLTWNNLTTKVYYGGGSSPASRTTLDYTKCKINTLGNHYFEITDTTRQWYEGNDTVSRLLVLDDGQRNMSVDTRATFSGYSHGDFTHQPQLVVIYRNTVGVEGIYDYHTQNIGRAGTASVNNFTLGLNLSVPICSAPSQALPFGLTLSYNSPLSSANFTSSSSVHTKSFTTSAVGYGWKCSVQQTVDRILLIGSDGTNRSWLIYTDADGTEHYFKRKDQTADYEDEDGLGLTITVNNTDNPTTFTMKDKEKNTWTFLYGYLSSFEDNNGNALYYAYNGYDYSSGNSNWKPSNASTVYRVTSVWRKNSGVSSATKLITLNYISNRLSSIVDMAGRTTLFGYDANNNLSTITYPDGETATYSYSNATVTNPQTGTTNTFHRLTTARDNEAQYEIRYTYLDSIAPRVKEIQEYSGAAGSEIAGTILSATKSSATATMFRYCGADNTLSTNDDIIVQYYFDHWGRPINIVTYDSDVSKMLGVSAGAYKQNKDANKDNNRLTNAAASGIQSANLVYNSGIEHLTNNSGDLYGWTKQGNGSAAARTTSDTAGIAEVTPRTGAYMMKLYLRSITAGKESCYQSVYLTGGETYVFSGYVNTASVADTGTVGAYLSFRTSSGTDISGACSRYLNYRTNTSVDNGWERLEAVYTPTQSGTYQVAVNLSHMAKVILADDLQLEKVTNAGGIEGEASASTANLIQLGGFELPASSGASTAEVSKFWRFSTDSTANDITIVEDADPNRGKVICLHNAPDMQIRAKQDVILNAPATRTYLVSAWGKMPVGYTSDGSNMKFNNATYERFFGIIAKIYYVGYSTPEHQYVAFNSALGGWQYTSGMIVPNETTRTVERIELNIAGELLPNDTYVDDVTLVQEPVQTYTYDANGNLTATTNTEGKTKTELDSQDRLKKYTAMNGVKYDLTYEGSSRQPKTIVSDGITTTYTYDDAGNVTNTRVQAPNNGIYLESSATYDSTKDFQTAATNTNGYTAYSSYNSAKGLLTSSTDPRGVTTNYTYDANNDRPASTYQSGNAKIYLFYQYDSNGRLKQINRKDYLGTALTRQGYHFDYDPWGNTTSIAVGSASDDTSDSLSSSVTLASYVYNVNGTLARMNYPSGQYVTYAYDKLDRLIEEVYYSSNDTVQADYRYIYNANGQLSKQYAVETTGGVETVTESYSFEYDSLGRLIRSREEGGSNLVQRTEHLYDGANRLTAQSWVVGDSSFTEEYKYNDPSDSSTPLNDGSLASMTAATGDTITFNYDGLKRSAGMTVKNSGGTVKYSIAQNYRTVSGSQTSTQVKFYNVKDSSGTVLSGWLYNYDANGNITKIKESLSPYRTLIAYTYDNLNQLTKETWYTYSGTSTTPSSTKVYTYTYDTAGNLLTSNDGTSTVTYTYGDSAWSDLLTAYDGHTISYIGGNPTNWYNGSSYTSLSWTQGRRLNGLTAGSTSVSYAYDMSGIRSSKTVGGVVHNYVTQNGRVIRESYGTTVLDFLYDANGRPFALRYSTNSGSSFTTYYYVLNAQGDVMGLLNSSGALIVKYSYDAWGKLLSVTNASGTAITSPSNIANINPLRYRGYYYDTETGFYYLQSRYYDPIVKRFLNADSYASTGQGFLGYNMFSYCKNNPVKFKEKAGEYSVTSFSYNYEEEDEYGTWGFSGTVYIYEGDEIKDISYFDNPDNRPSGYVSGRDIIVLDKRKQENPNMVVYNSYKIRDTKQQKEIISILLDYEKANPSSWKRTSESMLTEWKWHNRFALFSDSAKDTDFDLAEEGMDGWYYIKKAWDKSSIKQYIDNNPKPHWVLPV